MPVSRREVSVAGYISRATFLCNIANGDRPASTFETARGYKRFIGSNGLYPPLQPECCMRESKRLARTRLLATRPSPSLSEADALSLVPEAVYVFLKNGWKQNTATAWRAAAAETSDGAGFHVMDRGNHRFVALEDLKRAPRFQPIRSYSYRNDDSSLDTLPP
ncbi:hypothetical protein FVE85_9443 [Porphyridium purpureum]|uniref:Uncharacterized protein n=1 Tax=Porphyridium purpureum TaxID=35688 RepID=A0A5J4YIT2_PORPP|nr:hypothetical protein FVE85_9443 [Porphyridium purpureum]|eukprot:POR5729..scf261_15